jgi:hypothetical protein
MIYLVYELVFGIVSLWPQEVSGLIELRTYIMLFFPTLLFHSGSFQNGFPTGVLASISYYLPYSSLGHSGVIG